MTDLFSVDLDEGVIVVRYDGRPDAAAFQAYIDRFAALMNRGVPYAAVSVVAWRSPCHHH